MLRNLTWLLLAAAVLPARVIRWENGACPYFPM